MTTVQPTTRYVTVDGSRIAYQDFGHGAITLVSSSGSFSHTDVVWEDPAGALFYSRLGSFARVIRYDRLGTSNSDPLPPGWEPTHEAYERELGAVLDAVGVDHIVLLAVLDAGPYAIQYAVTHPDRVDRLILYNTTARFAADDGYDIGLPADAIDTIVDQVITMWGAEEQVALSAPSRAGDARFEAWYAKFLRSIGTPREIAELIRHAVQLDARDALAQVTVPTLVMHRTGYPIIAPSHGRYMAEHIAGAEYVEIPGVDGPMFWEEPDLLLRTMREFLTEDAPEATAQIATILFTDIVRSTERAESLGDREWAATVAVHLDVIRDAVTAFAGRFVKEPADRHG